MAKFSISQKCITTTARVEFKLCKVQCPTGPIIVLPNAGLHPVADVNNRTAMSLGPVNSAQCPVPSRIVPCPSHVGVAIMIRASLFHWLGGRTLFARRWWDLYWFEQNANVHEIRQSSPCLLFCFVFYFYYLFYFIFYCFILFCLI